MLHNYFKIAFKNLWRSRQFTFINTAGLTLGIAVFLFIIQYVAFEWKANRFNKNFDQLYRIDVQHKDSSTDYYLPPGFALLIKKQIPAIENYVHVSDGKANGVLTYKSDASKESKVFRKIKWLTWMAVF